MFKGELVYVSYGTIQDLDYLVEQGVDLKGKIFLARYGALFRGSKVCTTEIWCTLLLNKNIHKSKTSQ